MSRNIAYVSQSAWIFSGTLKENVLCGQTYDREKYDKVIKACALDKVCLSGQLQAYGLIFPEFRHEFFFSRISKIFISVTRR